MSVDSCESLLLSGRDLSFHPGCLEYVQQLIEQDRKVYLAKVRDRFDSTPKIMVDHTDYSKFKPVTVKIFRSNASGELTYHFPANIKMHTTTSRHLASVAGFTLTGEFTIGDAVVEGARQVGTKAIAVTEGATAVGALGVWGTFLGALNSSSPEVQRENFQFVRETAPEEVGQMTVWMTSDTVTPKPKEEPWYTRWFGIGRNRSRGLQTSNPSPVKPRLAESQEPYTIVRLGNPNPSKPTPPNSRCIDVDMSLNLSGGLQEGEESWNEHHTIVKRDFLIALRGLRDNFADRIESVMSVGYYSHSGGIVKMPGYERHTQNIITEAYRILKPGGELRIVVAEDVRVLVRGSIVSSGFGENNLRWRELRGEEARETTWTEEFALNKELKIIEFLVRKPN